LRLTNTRQPQSELQKANLKNDEERCSAVSTSTQTILCERKERLSAVSTSTQTVVIRRKDTSVQTGPELVRPACSKGTYSQREMPNSVPPQGNLPQETACQNAEVHRQSQWVEDTELDALLEAQLDAEMEEDTQTDISELLQYVLGE